MAGLFDDINLAQPDGEAEPHPSQPGALTPQPSAGLFDDISLSGADAAGDGMPPLPPLREGPQVSKKGGFQWGGLDDVVDAAKYGAKEAFTPFSVDPEEQKQALSTGAGTVSYLVSNVLTSLGANAVLGTLTGGVAAPIAGVRAAKSVANAASIMFAIYQGAGRDSIRTEGMGEEWKPLSSPKGFARTILSAGLEANPLLKVSSQLSAPLQIGLRAAASGVGEAALEKSYGGDNADAAIAGAFGVIGAGTALYSMRKAGQATEKVAKEAAESALSIGDALKVDNGLMPRIEKAIEDVGGLELPKEIPSEFKRYMVGDKGAELSTKKLDEAFKAKTSHLGPKKLAEGFRVMQTGKALSNVSGEVMEEDLAALGKAPRKDVNMARRLLEPMFYVSRHVDNATGLDTAQMIDKFVQAHHRQNNIGKVFTDKLKALDNKRHELGFSEDDVYHLITSEDPAKFAKIMDKPGAAEYKKAFTNYTDGFLDYLADQGYNPFRREDYLPTKSISRGKMASLLEGKVEELDDILKSEGLSLGSARAQLAEAIKTKGAVDELRSKSKAISLVDTLDKVAKHVGESPIEGRAGWEALKGKLLSNSKLSIDSDLTDVSALFRRTGEVPDAIRERDPFRLMAGYINENLKAAHFDEAMKYGEQYASVLKQMGMGKSAKLYEDYLTDQAGGARALAGHIRQIKTKMEYAGAEKVRKAQAILMEDPKNRGAKMSRAAGKMLEATPEFVSWLNSSIYTAKLSLNVPGYVRNFTQFATSTIPEIGYKYGAKTAMRAARNMSLSPAKIKAELEAKNLLSEFSRMETSEFGRVLGGVKGKSDDLSEKMFKAYQYTDSFNRAISWSMGKEIAADVMAGHKDALSFVGKLDNGTKQRISSMMAKTKGNPKAQLEGLHDIIGRNLVSKTQFDYSAANKAEWARLVGPYFSMFSTWPTMVASEIESTLTRKDFKSGAQKVASKFFPLYGLALVGEHLVEQADHPAANYMLNDLSSYTPLDSVWPSQGPTTGRGGVINNPTAGSFLKMGAQAASLDFKGAARTGMTDVATTYLGPVSAVINEADRMSKALNKKKLTAIVADEIGLKKDDK